VSQVLEKTEDLVRKAKALGADEVIAKTTFGRYRQTRFSNNQVDITVGWDTYTTDVALSWKKRVVGTQIADFTDSEKSIEQLINLAKVSKENPLFGGVAHGEFTYGKIDADKEVISIEKPTEYIQTAISAAEDAAGDKVDSGGILFAKYEDVYLVSSEGPVGRDARSAIQFSIRAFLEREASGHGVSCSSTLRDFKPSEAGRKAGEIARLARNPKVGEEGVYDIVFDPLIFGSMLNTWADMTSAFNVMIHRSIFANELGKNVASEIVTLRDVPAKYSISNRLFDDEGVPTRENVMIDHGILKTYLHNTSTAKLFKTETTGNAGLIVPTWWNVEMDPGKMTRGDLLGALKRGIYLTNTWYTRFQNYVTGDFSTIPRDGAFLVENGEIKQSLKEIRLSDNASRILQNVAGISRERQHVQWWGESGPCLSPYVLVKDVHITRPR